MPYSATDARPHDPLDDVYVEVGQGSADALGRFFDAAAPQVFALADRVAGTSSAQLVCRETFVELWQTASRFSPRHGSAMTRALDIAHRRAVEQVRRAGGSGPRVDGTVTAAGPDLANDCMGTLKEPVRRALELAYFDGLTYREISRVMDVPLPQMRSSLRDGLIRLHNCIAAGKAP